MKVLKPRVAQIGEQLEHRLVSELGVRPMETRMAGGREPVGDDARELVGRDAGVGRRHDLEKAFLAERRQCLEVALEHRLERLGVAPLRVLRRERLHPVHRERDLEIDRLLGPERAVVVEGRDALLDRDEIRPALLGHALDERDDRLLRRALVPGRQRIGLRERACIPGAPAANEQRTDGRTAI